MDSQAGKFTSPKNQRERSMSSSNSRLLAIVLSIAAASAVSGCGKKQSVEMTFSDYSVSRAMPATQGQATMMASAKAPARVAPAFISRMGGWLDGLLFPRAEAAL